MLTHTHALLEIRESSFLLTESSETFLIPTVPSQRQHPRSNAPKSNQRTLRMMSHLHSQQAPVCTGAQNDKTYFK